MKVQRIGIWQYKTNVYDRAKYMIVQSTISKLIQNLKEFSGSKFYHKSTTINLNAYNKGKYNNNLKGKQ